MERGSVVGDRFVLGDRIGSGGMGHVHRGVDRTTGDVVAIKILREGADDARFVREARVLRDVDHPGIVRHVADGPGWLAMEWLDGEDLERRLAQRPLSIEETITLARRLADALAAAHARGIVHRDLKPSNVLLPGGSVEGAKLLDFGIARASIAAGSTGTGIAIGTPGYMAPEQARGARDVGPAADVFSLGCVIFECASGRPAFAGDHAIAILARILLEDAPRLATVLPGAPPALDALVASMLAKEADLRPADGRAVLRALESVDAAGREAVPSTVIGSGEMSFASVLLVGAAPLALAATMPAAARATEDVALRDAAAGRGASCELLADGSIVLVWRGHGAATDLAAQAAAAALALRGSAPDRPIAVAVGRADVAGRVPVGVAIDRAAALLGGGPGIAIDDLAARLVSDRFEIESGTLRGAREREEVRTLLGRATPFVGRDAELAMLVSLFAQSAAESEARSAIVVAPPGIGKSRLRTEMLRVLAQRDERPAIVAARAEPGSARSPLALASDLLRRALGVAAGDLPARVEAALRARGHDRVVPWLSELLTRSIARHEAAAGVRPAHTPDDESLRGAFVEILLGACGDGPLVIVIEDLHWGDPASLALLDAALGALRDRPVFVLALARPELDEHHPELWRDRAVSRIALPPLPRRAAERLVRVVRGDDADPSRIVARSGGNAFFLEELIRADAEGWADTVPETITAMVQVRIDGFDPDARRVLRAASVLGETFWEEGVRALAGEGVDVARWIDELVRREVVERRARSSLAGARELAFRHAFVRDAAYGMLVDDDRVAGHRIAAEWLSGTGGADPVALADHFERGGLPDRAARWRVRASDAAIGARDLAGAIEHSRRALELATEETTRTTALQLQAEAHAWGGLLENPGPLERAIEQVAPSATGWTGAASIAIFLLATRGERERATAIARRVIEVGYRDAVADWARRSMFVAPWALFYVGERDLARALIEASRRARAADPVLQRTLDAYRAIAEAHAALFCDADPWRTYELTRYAVERMRETGDDPLTLPAAEQALGSFMLALGDYDEGEPLIHGAVVSAERAGAGWALSWARVGASLAPSRRRDLAATRELQRVIIEENAQRGATLLEGIARTGLAATSAMLKDAAGALRESTLAAEQLTRFPPMRAAALALRANVLLAGGEALRALEAAEEARSIVDAHGTWTVADATARLAEIEALAAVGRRDEARAASAAARHRLLDRAQRIPDPVRRESFLQRVRVHARIVDLASQLAST